MATQMRMTRVFVNDDPDEMDAIAGAVDQQPGDPAKDAGQPIYASYKLDGGSNYREL